MKKFFCLLFFVFYPFLGFAATEAGIQRRAFGAPDSVSDNVKSLTAYLTKGYDSDYDKLKVIAYWMASHIVYDGYKYDSSAGVNAKAFKYKYDILKAKVGICSDFAQLFSEMATAAGVKNVSVVSGYVVKTKKLKRKYSQRELPAAGHAWNRVTADGRTFYVDTTFMAPEVIGATGKKFKSEFKHKTDIKKRERKSAEVNTRINTFYFDFVPPDELEKYGTHHWNPNPQK